MEIQDTEMPLLLIMVVLAAVPVQEVLLTLTDEQVVMAE
jgi:hypothetical protein